MHPTTPHNMPAVRWRHEPHVWRRLYLSIFGGLLATACGDPAKYPYYAADTGPDLELLQEPASGAGSGLPTLDGTCAAGPAACSVSDGPSTTVEIINNSDHIIDLVWIDGRCGGTLYQSAAPGTTIQQQSYSDHVWALVDQPSGTELGRILAVQTPVCSVTVQ